MVDGSSCVLGSEGPGEGLEIQGTNEWLRIKCSQMNRKMEVATNAVSTQQSLTIIRTYSICPSSCNNGL